MQTYSNVWVTTVFSPSLTTRSSRCAEKENEMEKKKKLNIAISKTPEELEAEAREFWMHLFHQHQIQTVAFSAELQKRFSPPAGAIYRDPFDYREFVTRMIKKEECDFACSWYDSCVKPRLPWQKIKACFNGLKIDEESFDSYIDAIIMILKPWPFTNEFTKGDPQITKLVKETCDNFKKLRKQLAPVVSQLDNMQFIYRLDRLHFPKSAGYDSLWHIPQYIHLKLWIDQVIKYGEQISNLHFRYFGIEKGYYRSPQDHPFWRYATAGAVYYVNYFCHKKTCSHNMKGEINCKIIHEASYQIVANLLQILYPNIWNEDSIEITKKVKRRAFRFINPAPSPQIAAAEKKQKVALAKKMAKIMKAIPNLKKEDFSDSGLPRLNSLFELFDFNFDIQAWERELAWAEFKKANPNWTPK